MVLRSGLLVTSFLLVAFALVSNNTRAASRPATEAECKMITDAGGSCQVGVTPYDPNTPGLSMSGAQAKEYLRKLPCPGGKCDFGSNFNDKFAVCAAQFLEAYQKRHGAIRVNSAYRSADHERTLCRNNPRCGAQMNNSNPTSNHIKGVAMDVQPANEADYSKMWDLARTNPQFGVCFPFEDGTRSGFRDRPHMILAGFAPGSSEVRSCTSLGYGNQPCSGGPPLNVTTPPPSQNVPTASASNYFRNAFGMQPQPYYQPPLPPQPYTQQQSLLNSFSQPMQPQTQQPIGVSGQIITNTNSNQNTNTSSSSATSVGDQLLQLAFGTSSSPSASTGLATSVPLVITSGNSGSIVSTQQPVGTNNQQPVGSIQSVGQQTFVSNDLGTQQPIATQTYNSRLQETLGTLRTALTMLLNYLTPFSARTQPQTIVDLEAIEY